MSELGNREVRKSRAPYFLVAAVGIAIVVAAVTTSILRRVDVQALTPSATPADRAMSAIGTPPPSNHIASARGRTAAMTASREGRRDESKQKLRDARLAAANRFEQESVDPVWSAGKENRLQTLAQESPTYRQAGIVPESMQIDCRSTLCKVTAKHASYGASADWAMIFMTSSAGEVERFHTTTIKNPDGTSMIEIYAEAR